MIKFFLLSLIILTSSSWAKKTGELLPEGKSEKLKDEFIKHTEKPFAYQPTDGIFWDELTQFEKKSEYVKMAEFALDQVRRFGEASDEGKEALLAFALALHHMRLFSASYHINEKLAVEKNGTFIGAFALKLISEADMADRVDRVRLESLINNNEFSGLHPEIQSFVSFYKYFYNLKFNYKKWAQINLDKVKEATFWRYKIIYLEALGQIARNHLAKGKQILLSLIKLEEVPAEIKTRANIQLARLSFEEGKLEDAFNIYSTIGRITNREKGRIELERAWTQYYLKNYSKALGILTALKTPFYSRSITPERYVLEMVIYKELCHYGAVEKAAQKFKKVFGPSLSRIKKRKPLRDDPILFSMAIVDRPLEVQANVVHFIRLEQERLIDLGFDYEGMEQIYASLKNHEKGIRERIDFQLEEKAREAANELLDIEEQISFIEYISRLDALKILEEKQEDFYRPERISHVKFNKIYWPWTGEFWIDEVDKYQTLISSRCENESNGKEGEVNFE